MQRPLFVVLLIATQVQAQEPHLEFVERLRAAEMADIALEYLDHIGANSHAELKARLQIERARTLVALAEQVQDDRLRNDRMMQARWALQEHIKNLHDDAAIADARLELSRLLIRHGRFRIAAARHLESAAERQDALAKARQSFDEADNESRFVSSATGNRIYDVKFNTASITMYRAMTYFDVPENRVEGLQDARRQFMELAESESQSPICWRAFVEWGRCCMELENHSEAFRVFSQINRSPKAPVDVARTAGYYELRLMDRQGKSSSAELISGCEDWLNRYAAFRRTPEGQGVQYLLATTLINQAQSGLSPATSDKPISLTGAARSNLERAERLLKKLIDFNGEYSRRADTLRNETLVTLMAERAAGGIERLMNLEDCVLLAQVEAHHAFKKSSDAALRHRHFRRAIDALRRGLLMITPSDDSSAVFDARMMLCYMYLADGDPYSSAIVGEHLARSNISAARGARAAAYALSAYATIISESRRRHAPPDEIAADVQRLRSLAEFAGQTWPNEPDTDAAHFQLGNLFLEDKQYADACDMLAKISDRFPALAFARFRQGVAAQLAQQASIPAEAKKKLLTHAIVDLGKVPDPTRGVSRDMVMATYQARLQLAQLLLLSGENAETLSRVGTIGADLKAKLATYFDKSDPMTEQLEAECERMRLAGLWGQAHFAIQDGQYEKANALLEPQLRTISSSGEQWKKSRHTDEAWHQAFLQTQRDILLLDARANILAGRPDKLKETLRVIQVLTTDGAKQATYDQLIKLVFDLKNDLDVWIAKKDLQRQRTLQEGLTRLLDEVSQQKDLSLEARMILAHGYSAIDQHPLAAKLLADIPAPNSQDESRLREYRAVRLMLAREYRLAGEFAHAKTILREILGTPQQKGWGYDNFDVRAESIALLEDEGQFAGAVRMAVQMQQQLAESVREYDLKSAKLRHLRQAGDSEHANEIERDVRRLSPLRERYYEFYLLEVRAIVRHASKTDDAKSQDAIRRIAGRLVKLEAANPDFGGAANKSRFASLIADNASLQAAYQKMGGTVLLAKP